MAPPEISRRVLDAKLEACRFAFSKLSAVRTSRMKNYAQLRSLVMMKEIARRGADRDFLRDPENTVTRILCSVLKQVASNSERCLLSLGGSGIDDLDGVQKQPVFRMIASIQSMARKKFVAVTTPVDETSEPLDMDLLLGNGDDLSGAEADSSLRGPIVWPEEHNITEEWVENLMSTLNWFTWKNSVSEFSSVVPHSAAVSLLERASEILDKEANCVKINGCIENSKVMVVGDLHGHLHDLLKIFNDAGRPSENHYFVFNGNYIGRGLWSLEVFLVLLAWKILMPERVFLLRGNHETKSSLEEHGFCNELCDRYGEDGGIVYEKLLDCFKLLPLASLIEDTVYTTHGGLFRSTEVKEEGEKAKVCLGSLTELDQTDRRHVGESEGNPVILNDVLRSCPWMEHSLSANNVGGAGLLWGPDCTGTFLRQPKLKVIIRSHEGPDARVDREDMGNMLSGCSLDHETESGKLYTLFSASMFSQGETTYQNEGAYAVVESPDFANPRFISFTTESMQKHHQLVTVEGHSPLQACATNTRSGVDFAAIGISNPPAWTISLANDASSEFPLLEAPEAEGLPLPENIQEPHRSNYEYLFTLISALKQEIRTRDDRERKLMDQMKNMKEALDVIRRMTSSLPP